MQSQSSSNSHWMEKATAKPSSHGHLHRALGVPEGKPIPENKMSEALAGKHGDDVRKMALEAKNMEHASGNTSHLPGGDPKPKPKFAARNIFAGRNASQPTAQPQAGPQQPGQGMPQQPPMAEDDDDDDQTGAPISARGIFGR